MSLVTVRTIDNVVRWREPTGYACHFDKLLYK